MAARAWSKKEILDCIEILKKCEDMRAATHAVWKKHKRSMDALDSVLKRSGFKSPGQYLKIPEIGILTDEDFKSKVDHELEVKRLTQERDQYRALYDKLRNERISGEHLKNIIHEIAGYKPHPRPSWTIKDRKASQHGIPVLHISDVHWDETVNRAQVNGLNEYNLEIQEMRLNYTFQKAADLLMNHFSKPDYDGIKLCVNGDLISGNIHEELRESNARPVLKSVASIVKVLSDNIAALAKVFKFVDVDFQVGNHGRIDKKPRMKNGVIDNYEWMAAHSVAKAFAGSGNVTVHVPDSFDTIFRLYKRNYLLTHGDAFFGGSGIGGILVPILRGLAKKQQTYAKVGQPVDVMMIGHFHQLHMLPYLIINGSTKGYDEYALKYAFPFEKPMQSLHIEHPEHCMVFCTPIHCDGYKGDK